MINVGPWQILQLLTMVVKKPFAHEEVQQFLTQLCLQLPPSADPPQTAKRQAAFSFWSEETSAAGAVRTDTHASSGERQKALDGAWKNHEISSFCVAYKTFLLWAACVALKPFPHVKPTSSNFSSPSTAIKRHPLFIKLKSFANTAWHSNLLTVFAYSLIGGILHPKVIWICSLSKQTFFFIPIKCELFYPCRFFSDTSLLPVLWSCVNFSFWRFSNLFKTFICKPFFSLFFRFLIHHKTILKVGSMQERQVSVESLSLFALSYESAIRLIF